MTYIGLFGALGEGLQLSQEDSARIKEDHYDVMVIYTRNLVGIVEDVATVLCFSMELSLPCPKVFNMIKLRHALTPAYLVGLRPRHTVQDLHYSCDQRCHAAQTETFNPKPKTKKTTNP